MYLKEKLKFNFEVVHVIFIKLKLSSKLLFIQEIVCKFWSIYTVLKAGEDISPIFNKDHGDSSR